jgi:glutamate synthase (ferredoxin)
LIDSAGRFEQRHNPELVKIEHVVEPADSRMLRQLVQEHTEKTWSDTARGILEDGPLRLLWFWKVRPRSKPASASAEPVPLSCTEPAKV